MKDIMLDYDKNYPFCIEGTGDGAPEDVGGIPGYEEYLEIMENNKHPEYERMKRWADSQRYRKLVEKNSNNYRLVEDYNYWFCNR